MFWHYPHLNVVEFIIGVRMKQLMYKAEMSAEVLGMSLSTFNRNVKSGRFPKGVRLSPRRIAWSMDTLVKIMNGGMDGQAPESINSDLAYSTTWRSQNGKK